MKKIFLLLSILLICASCNSKTTDQPSVGLDLSPPINNPTLTPATSKSLDNGQKPQVANQATDTQAEALLKIQKCQAQKEAGLASYLAAGQAQINGDIGKERVQDYLNIISQGPSYDKAMQGYTEAAQNSLNSQGANSDTVTDYSSAMSAETKALELQQQQEQNMINLSSTIYASKARQEKQDLEVQAEQIFNRKYSACLNK